MDEIRRVDTVYEVLTRELQALGVRDTFGLMSQDTVRFIAYSADRGGIMFHSSRHESVAVMMADGYAWAGGGLGIAILGRGPGLANAVAAARTTTNTHRRVMLIAGEANVGPYLGPDGKAADSRAFAEAIGVAHFPARSADEVVSAFRATADSAQRGRVALLTIPNDVLNGPIDGHKREPGPALARRARSTIAALHHITSATPLSPLAVNALEPASAEVAEAARVLAASSRPLILAGRGAVAAGAKPRLEALAERTGALLGTTVLAKDLFYGHPYDLGVVGGFVSDAARELLREVDCVIAFGASLNSYTTHQHALFQGVPVVHVDIDATAINAHFPAQVGLVADANTAAARLLDLLPQETGKGPFHERPTLERLGQPLYRGPDESTEIALDPRVLVQRLDNVLPRDLRVVVDGGHYMGFAAVYAHVPEAGRFRLTLDFGSIGQGLGAALGAAVACPAATTVLFIGDGGLLMTLGDLESVARCRPRLVIVVMNNQAYRSEVHHLERAKLPQGLAAIPDTDFAAIARALGINAATLRTLDDLEAVTPQLAGTGPILLDCKIRPDIRGPQWKP